MTVSEKSLRGFYRKQLAANTITLDGAMQYAKFVAEDIETLVEELRKATNKIRKLTEETNV